MSISDFRMAILGSRVEDFCVLFVGTYYARGDIKLIREEIGHRRLRVCE